MLGSELQIVRLQKAHRRDAFDCGTAELTDYLRRFARQNDRKGIGRAYVAVCPGEALVRGYYTLASSSVAHGAMPDTLRQQLPRYPVPTVLIARLAVDVTMQGRGLGRELLMDSCFRILQAADEIGILAIEVLAQEDQARGFYEKYGFASLLDEPRHMFLSIQAAKRAFGLPTNDVP